MVQGKVDLGYLSCQHHVIMVEELGHYVDTFNSGLERVLVLGLGGGALCTYLHEKFPQLVIDGVEIDPMMETLAKKYFGFKQSENLKSHIADGLSFVQDCVASGN